MKYKESVTMDENSRTFNYTYSAKEQEDIRHIREKYVPQSQEEDALAQLRRLDAGSTRPATAVSILVGTLGILIMGVGMCCCLIPLWRQYFAFGIILGILGMACAAAAYPLYTRMVKAKQARLAPEILRLSEKLMK